MTTKNYNGSFQVSREPCSSNEERRANRVDHLLDAKGQSTDRVGKISCARKGGRDIRLCLRVGRVER